MPWGSSVGNSRVAAYRDGVEYDPLVGQIWNGGVRKQSSLLLVLGIATPGSARECMVSAEKEVRGLLLVFIHSHDTCNYTCSAQHRNAVIGGLRRVAQAQSPSPSHH